MDAPTSPSPAPPARPSCSRAGEVSPRELVELYLERIERLDPQLNAFRVVLAERALAEADQADGRRGARRRRAPLLGVPVAIKDDVDVAGEVTALGHVAPTAARPPRTPRSSARLRDAGAIVLGKTHVPELTIWPFTESPTCGVTRNPWDPSRTPGRLERRHGRRGRRGPRGRRRSAPTARARSASPPPAAACSGSSRSAAASRWRPHDDAWHGLSVNGPLTRTVRRRRAVPRRDRRRDRRPAGRRSPRPRPRAPGRLRIAVSTAVAAGRAGAARRRRAPRAARRPPSCCASLGHEVDRARPDYPPAPCSATVVARYLRGIADDVAHACRTRSGWSGARARWRGMGAADARRGARAGARRRGRRDRARSTRSSTTSTSLLTPGRRAAARSRSAAATGRGALWTLNGVAALTCRTPAVERRPASRPPRCPPASTPTGCRSASSSSAARTTRRTLLSLAAQIEAARPWADRRPPRR